MRVSRGITNAGAAALAGAAVLLGASPARAATLTISADPTSIEVGEGVRLVLALEGANARARPVLTFPKGVRLVQGPSVQQQIDMVRGSRSIQYGYTLGFDAAGAYTLGPATILSTRGRLKSGTVKIAVRAAGTRKDVIVAATLEPARAYVGQPVTATFVYGEARKVAARRLVVPFLREIDGVRVSDPENLAERWIESRGRGLPGCEVLRLASPDEQVVARVSRREVDGTEYRAYTVRRLLIPGKPGTRELGEAAAAASVVVGYRRSRDPFGSVFDDPFGDSIFSSRRAVTKTATAASAPLTLEVLSVPEEGRPPGYSGAVGSYELSAAASPLETALGGDPMMLTLTVSGEGDIGTVAQPVLADDSSFRVGSVEQKQETRFEGGKLLGEKRFTMPLRPRSADVKEVPEARLVVFDPAQAAYVTLRTDPIPVRVTVPEDSGALESVALPESARARMREREKVKEDIEDVETDVDAAGSDAAWLHRPAGLLGFFALPLAAYAGLAVVARRRRELRENTALARRLSAARAARASLAGLHAEVASTGDAEFAEAVAKTLQGYLADRLDRPGGEIPPDEAERLLVKAGVDGDRAREAAEIIREAGKARFGGGGVERSGLLRRAEACVEAIERGGGR